MRPTPTPSWFNDELPNSAMHPEEIEGATKTNSLKVNDELSYIAAMDTLEEEGETNTNSLESMTSCPTLPMYEVL